MLIDPHAQTFSPQAISGMARRMPCRVTKYQMTRAFSLYQLA